MARQLLVTFTTESFTQSTYNTVQDEECYHNSAHEKPEQHK